jgi:hypothetical protein
MRTRTIGGTLRPLRSPRTTRLGRRVAAIGTLLVGAFAALIGLATPAGATITTNTIGCAGSATVNGTGGDAGKTVTVNANDAKVTMLREGTADWQGSITTTTHNHSGQVVVDLGWFKITAGKWGPSANASNENSKSGQTKLPSALKYVPPGDYKITGYHQGDEGRCAGSIDVRFNGSLVSNPIGIAALIATILAAAGVGFAAIARSTP